MSLALNIFVAGGAIFSKMTAERLENSPEQRIQLIAEQLELSAEQRQGLEDLRAKARERWSGSRGQWGDQRRQTMAEIAKPELDVTRIETMMRERSEARIVGFTETARDLHGFLATLSPEQREAFTAMSEERGFLWRLIGSSRSTRSTR